MRGNQVRERAGEGRRKATGEHDSQVKWGEKRQGDGKSRGDVMGRRGGPNLKRNK